jgi:hypothetical protein
MGKFEVRARLKIREGQLEGFKRHAAGPAPMHRSLGSILELDLCAHGNRRRAERTQRCT